MPKTRTQKENTLVELTDKIKSSRSVVFADFKGMNMGQLTDLRQKLADQKAEFTVTKNSLVELALKQAGKPQPTDDIVAGPTATLFAFEDEVAPIKTLVKALKDAQTGKIKGGILGDNLIDEYTVNRLANLPSKEELIGKTVNVIAAPLQGIVGVLNANLRNLVYTLDQIRVAKSK
jgi:large subunit ribosomal protein L10